MSLFVHVDFETAAEKYHDYEILDQASKEGFDVVHYIHGETKQRLTVVTCITSGDAIEVPHHN